MKITSAGYSYLTESSKSPALIAKIRLTQTLSKNSSIDLFCPICRKETVHLLKNVPGLYSEFPRSS